MHICLAAVPSDLFEVLSLLGLLVELLLRLQLVLVEAALQQVQTVAQLLEPLPRLVLLGLLAGSSMSRNRGWRVGQKYC